LWQFNTCKVFSRGKILIRRAVHENIAFWEMGVSQIVMKKSEEGKPKKLIGDGLALSSILKVISFMDSP